MTEPHALGFKVSVLVAAAFGSMVSLVFRAPMTVRQMLACVLTGFASAIYFGPAAGSLLQQLPALLKHPEIELPGMYEAGVFLVGVSAMNIIPGWLRLVDRLGLAPKGEKS